MVKLCLVKATAADRHAIRQAFELAILKTVRQWLEESLPKVLPKTTTEKASTNIYSLVETAKANDLEPYAYLRFLFSELPKAVNVDDIEWTLCYALTGVQLWNLG